MELRHRSQAKKDTYKESDWIDDLFIQADLDKSGKVSVEECMKVNSEQCEMSKCDKGLRRRVDQVVDLVDLCPNGCIDET